MIGASGVRVFPRGVDMPNKKKPTKKHEPTRLDDARARMYHELVFESAECVFGGKGFAQATMQEIAHEAGISLKTVYATVGGKQELYEEVQRVRAHELIDCVTEASRSADGPAAALESGVRAHVGFLFEHPHYLRLQLQANVAWGIGPMDGQFADPWQLGVGRFADIVAAGIEAGVFYEGDAAEMSRMAQAIIQVQLAKVIEMDAPDRDAIADGILLQLRRLLYRDVAA